jgi:aspartate/methionine/tyrosine aminotransferase
LTAALVNPGDEVLVADPSYPCNRHFLASFGAEVKLVPTTAATRFQLDTACFEDESLAICEQRRAHLAARRTLVLRGLDAMTFCERVLHEAHVALTPGYDFGRADAAAYVRLSYAASEPALVEALARLRAVLSRWRAQPTGA